MDSNGEIDFSYFSPILQWSVSTLSLLIYMKAPLFLQTGTFIVWIVLSDIYPNKNHCSINIPNG